MRVLDEMTFELTFLGTNSALPAHGRFPTAQVLNVCDRHFLIDCGEGTQARMLEHQVKRHKINQIFISHLHGDHVFGLIGLLTSFNLLGRKQKLDIFAPPGIRELIEIQLKCSHTILTYELDIHITDPEQHYLLFENSSVEVYSIPLLHRIPTHGFLFKEKERPLNIISEKIQEYQLNVKQIKAAKLGSNIILSDGTEIPNEELTKKPSPPRSYAYCSDTVHTETILPYIQGVDLLYHESTFLADDRERAKVTMHSTTLEAAAIALKAEAKLLMLGHYSSRHKDVSIFAKEAQSVFSNTVAAREGMRVEVAYDREAAASKIILKDP